MVTKHPSLPPLQWQPLAGGLVTLFRDILRSRMLIRSVGTRVYLMLTGCLIAFMVATCFVTEPVTERESLQREIEAQYSQTGQSQARR